MVPLIINGDDFGASPAINRAIIHAHRHGVLTSASLMVNESAAAEAVRMARENPGLAVGLHLALVLGQAALPHTEIPHITDLHGRFGDDPARAGLRYFFSRAARREMRREMRAQFARFAATELPFSHVDGHTLLHMHPAVFAELIPLCEEFNVRRVRIVRGETWLSLRLDRRHVIRRLLTGGIFAALAWNCERRLRGRDFSYPPRVYGLMRSGAMTEDYLAPLLEQAPPLGAEIYLHPREAAAEQTLGRFHPPGARELDALTSPRIRELIAARGFRLTTYAGRSQKSEVRSQKFPDAGH
ncbi:MAG: hopanoid biosynthesis-associated protein HpnK [Blastocatellia bacterium]